jgi:hypothetical protein
MSKARPRQPGPLAPAAARRRAPKKPGESRRSATWRAWSNDGARIVATGPSFETARDAARASGEADPIVEPIPRRGRLA